MLLTDQRVLLAGRCAHIVADIRISVTTLNRECCHFVSREHHLPLGQAHAVHELGDFRVIMTTMKLNHTYLTHDTAAVVVWHGLATLRAE